MSLARVRKASRPSIRSHGMSGSGSTMGGRELAAGPAMRRMTKKTCKVERLDMPALIKMFWSPNFTQNVQFQDQQTLECCAARVVCSLYRTRKFQTSGCPTGSLSSEALSKEHCTEQ